MEKRKRMKKGYSFIAKVCGFLCVSWLFGLPCALAQYDDIRYPQKPEEIALFKKNKVQGETQWIQKDTKKLPNMTRAFDPEGRVVIAQDYNHIKYYKYDGKGYVTEFLDSARKDSGYTRNDYTFRYYDNGLLQEVDGPGFKSQFIYDPARKKLTETMVKGDTTRKNIFYYDSKLRFKDAIYYSPEHYRTAHFIKNYGDDGRLYNECVVQMTKSYKDSVLSINEYNDKKQLVKKQVFTFLDFKYSDKGSKYFDRSASHYGAATYEYNLDSMGRPVAEEYSVKDDKLNYSFSTWTYDKNGLVTKETFLFGHGDPKITLHEYYYYK